MTLIKYRLPHSCDFHEQVLIVHIPGTDLDDVYIFCDQVDLRFASNFSHNGHFKSVTGLAEPLQGLGCFIFASTPQSLKGMNGTAWLEDAAPQHLSAGFLDAFGDSIDVIEEAAGPSAVPRAPGKPLCRMSVYCDAI